ncbi:MAG: ABC transporter permease [Termitinemataceae bacterium]|nr:MAG: ABC transporter permease [Termitinemataceae bacterium]
MGSTWHVIWQLLPKCTLQTLYMTIASTIAACILGFPTGALLFFTSPVGFKPRKLLYNILSRIVNVFRSFPFIILMVIVIPFSRKIVGTSIGPTAVIIPLSIAAAPFVARIVESALQEVDGGVILAARAMGSTNMQILLKVMVFEAMPTLVSGMALTIITVIGYSAMAGALGGEGLGDMAISYGYYRFRWDIATAAIIVILLLIEMFQAIGTSVSRSLLSKR